MRLAPAVFASLFLTSLLSFAQNGAHQAAGIESGVQAFVPSLTPLNRTLPPRQNLNANVQLLVTLDADGRVTAVEPLSGPESLRKTAAEMVQDWRYRPVLRDGHGVSAYTTAFVAFFAPGKQITVDSTEELTAATRVNQLQQQYPRTPAMVLGDLEQDCTGLPDQERFYALAKLAKAAWSAGAVDKAAAYANELVASVQSNPKSWNDGNAVHDGNAVLGLVALRAGNLVQAGKYLLEAGRTPGSPQLNSFGPNVTLAKQLLEQGQREIVLQYFEECRTFWKTGASKLDAWTAAVQKGLVPDFGPNLVY